MKVAFYMCLRMVLWYLFTNISAIEQDTDEAEDLSDEFELQRLDRLKGKGKFGGVKMDTPPDTLIVTEEIWFDIQIPNYYGKDKPLEGKITVGCFGALAPITCLNFISLAQGYRKGRQILSYKDTKVHKIIRDFSVQMGEVSYKDGGGDSIFGKNFKDETFALSHNHGGWVGMANYGADTNGSQFYILLGPARWLDGKHVVFAKVLKGMDFIKQLGYEETNRNHEPKRKIIISNSGINKIKKSYELKSEQFNIDGDILVE